MMLQLFDDPGIQNLGRPGKASSAAWSAAIHGAVFVFLVSLSLSPAFQDMPLNVNFVSLAPPMAPPPPPPPPAARPSVTVARIRPTPRVFEAKLTAPVVIPKNAPEAEILADLPPDIAVMGGVPGGVEGGVVGGVLGGIPGGIGGSLSGVMGGTGTFAPPPPPPPAPKAAPPPPPPAPKVVQVSAEIQEAKLLEIVRPAYPMNARLARLQGVVRMRATIDAGGRIAALEVVEGHPMLADAARAAVLRWRYRPTFIGEQAVSVATEIIVNFRLT